MTETPMTGNQQAGALDYLRYRDLPIYTLTFARDLTIEALLTRMGVDPATLAVRDQQQLSTDFGDDLFDMAEPVVTTGTHGSWAWAWEYSGWHGLDKPLLQAVSAGTEAVAIHHNERGDRFCHAREGRLTTDFSTLRSDPPTTTDPRLAQHLHRLNAGQQEGGDPHAELTLAEDVFGIGLGAGFGRPCLSGRLRPIHRGN